MFTGRAKHTWWLLMAAAALVLAMAGCKPCEYPCGQLQGSRHVINLNGTWQVAEGRMEEPPHKFEHEVPVPGLLDMAEPAFERVGFKSDKREAFWYRRQFQVAGPIGDVAILKVNKAKYGTKVFLNGEEVGEHKPCFTPGYFDLRENLKGNGKTNELIVRVGADRDSVGPEIPSGHDFEKHKYIPGIYDDVSLILSGYPYMVNVQVVPQIEKQIARVAAEVDAGVKSDKVRLRYTIREAKSGKVVATGTSPAVKTDADGKATIDFEIPVAGCRLWSPEDPFLYALELSTGSDDYKTRFGMRSFRVDKDIGRAILNGKPYFMRGTNVCVYRFFEDELRGDKPWRAEWVRRLHRQFRHMHWNSIRYCIGFPPEIWYEIADEEGFLIQDEFPIWAGIEHVSAEEVAKEYEQWMRERWNHPCVVIWDAQNETVTPVTGRALSAVRKLDLSNRPWDNGWSAPHSEDDVMETHPYLFSAYKDEAVPSERGALADNLTRFRIPNNGPNERSGTGKHFGNPNIINEYGWLWLNRDGTTTTLTENIYRKVLGEDTTVEQRRRYYARTLATLTEYWRCNRTSAGVLHFCGLGYSRSPERKNGPPGQTSDNFIDLEALEYEPFFEKYVRDSFSPVGLMITKCNNRYEAGAELDVPVFVFNDLYEVWSGDVRVSVAGVEGTVSQQKISVEPLGRELLHFTVQLPEQAGRYTLIAELEFNGEDIQSLRDFELGGEHMEN